MKTIPRVRAFPSHRCGRLLLLALAAAACTAAGPLAAQESEVYTAKTDPDGVQRVRIVGGSYFFKPSRIRVKANVPVELTVVKEQGVAPHNIVIEAADAGIAVREDLDTEPKKIAFTPKKAGRYPFYCSNQFLFFASHRERGMEGLLEVVP